MEQLILILFSIQGNFLALEEGHRPFGVNPLTLESRGAYDYEGKLNSAMTAHPKIDPQAGDMIGFSYGFGVNKMSYFVINSPRDYDNLFRI